MCCAQALPLSQELIDEIIDYFTEQSHLSTLKACSLICRSFTHRCQMHMFSTIKISSDFQVPKPQRAKRIQDFLEILQRKPRLASYIRNFSLTISSYDNAWITGDPNFLRILELIRESANRIRRLEITGFSYGLPVQFADIRTFERRPLQPFMITPFITSLHIENMANVPISLIARCVNLKDLSLDRIGLTPLDDNISEKYAFGQARPQIQSFSFTQSPGALEILLKRGNSNVTSPLIDISALRVLKTNTEFNRNMQGAQEIIDISQSSLEELYLANSSQISSGRRSTYTCLSELKSLSNLSSLIVLEVDILFENPSTTGDPLMDLCRILTSIPAATKNRKLRITVYFGNLRQSIMPDYCFNANWEMLDNEVLRFSAGKLLEFCLHIVYQAPYDDSDIVDEEMEKRYLEDLCRATFSKLTSERLLQVNHAPYVALTLTHHINYYPAVSGSEDESDYDGL